MLVRTSTRRRGATLVELAVVQPIFFLLLFGILTGGILIFNYQQVAWLSRETSRRASVRGSQYAKETGNLSPTKADLLQTVVLPLAYTMDPKQVTLDVFVVDGNTGVPPDWDSSPKTPYDIQSDGSKVANTVRVRVTYQWNPLYPFTSPITLQAISEVPMSF
jgi:Flp pilus assembly protein TadG